MDAFLAQFSYLRISAMFMVPILALMMAVGLGVGGLGAAISKSVDKAAKPGTVLALAVLFAIIGVTLGVLSGASRTPVIGIVLPALLTFVSTLVTYLIDRKAGGSVAWRNLMPTAIASLLIASLAGVFYGAELRKRGEWSEKLVELRATHLKALYTDLCLDMARRRMGLTAPPEGGKPSVPTIDLGAGVNVRDLDCGLIEATR